MQISSSTAWLLANSSGKILGRMISAFTPAPLPEAAAAAATPGAPTAARQPAARFRDTVSSAIPHPKLQTLLARSAASPAPYFPDAPARPATADRALPATAAARRVAATTASDTALPFPDSWIQKQN